MGFLPNVRSCKWWLTTTKNRTAPEGAVKVLYNKNGASYTDADGWTQASYDFTWLCSSWPELWSQYNAHDRELAIQLAKQPSSPPAVEEVYDEYW
jgi:hypothetical protein